MPSLIICRKGAWKKLFFLVTRELPDKHFNLLLGHDLNKMYQGKQYWKKKNAVNQNSICLNQNGTKIIHEVVQCDLIWWFKAIFSHTSRMLFISKLSSSTNHLQKTELSNGNKLETIVFYKAWNWLASASAKYLRSLRSYETCCYKKGQVAQCIISLGKHMQGIGTRCEC